MHTEGRRTYGIHWYGQNTNQIQPVMAPSENHVLVVERNAKPVSQGRTKSWHDRESNTGSLAYRASTLPTGRPLTFPLCLMTCTF